MYALVSYFMASLYMLTQLKPLLPITIVIHSNIIVLIYYLFL